MELDMDKRRKSYTRKQKSLERNDNEKRSLKTNSQIPPDKLQPKEEKHRKQHMKRKRLRYQCFNTDWK